MENFDLKKYLANNPLLIENFILRLKNERDEKLNTDLKINSKPTSFFGNSNEGWDVKDLQDIFKKAGLTVKGETQLELIDSSGKVIKTGQVFGYGTDNLPMIVPASKYQKSYDDNPFNPKNVSKKIQQYIENGFKGDLYLSNTKLTSLPNDLLKVGGNLGLGNVPITGLLNNFKVEKDLNLNNTSISSLPDDLQVGGDVILSNTPLSKKYTEEEIKQMVPGVKGAIKIK